MFFKQKVRWVRIADTLSALESRIEMNHVLVIERDGYRICLGRNSQGVHAVKDKCPHQGYSFKGGGCSEDGKMICPIHRYGFDVKTGRGGGSAVPVYPLEEREDGVYAGIEYVSFL